MRDLLVILALGALIARAGEVRAQTADTSPLEGVVTLVDAGRNLLVIQEGENARAVKLDGAMPEVKQGERIRVAGNFTPYYGAFPDYPARPSGSEMLPSFEAPTDWNDHFVSRARGFVHAPVDGEYTFWMLADDEAELLLGSNSDPATAKLIASVRHGTWPGMWDQHPEQKSQAVRLRRGERYYIEALQLEWRGHDRLAVAWQGPTFEREVIGGEHLSPWSATGGATNGILFEYWTNCFITRLAVLTPQEQVFGLSEARVESLGSGRLPAVRPVSPGVAAPEVRSFTWVEVEGTVAFAAADDGVLDFELKESNGRDGTAAATLRVNVLNWGDGPVAHLLNRKLRARGVCERAPDAPGRPAGGILWVQDERELRPLNFADDDRRDLEALPMFELTPANANLAWGRKVLVRGTVMSYDEEAGTLVLRGEDSFHSYSSSDGKNWTPVGVPVPVAMSDSIFGGLAASSQSETRGMQATFGQLSFDLHRDTNVIPGSHQPEGSVTFSNGAVTLWPTRDNKEDEVFFFQPLQNEGEIIACLQSFETVRSSDRAGVMMRESLNADAPYVALEVIRDTRLDLRYRESRGGRARVVAHADGQAPCWMKLARRRHTVAVQLMGAETLQRQQQVEVIGRLNWINGEPVLMDAYVRPTKKMEQPAPVTAELREVHIADLPTATSEDEQYQTQDYLIRGVVTFKDQAFDQDLLFLQDETGAALIRVAPGFFNSERIKPGQLLEAKGVVRFSPEIPPFRLNTGTVLGWSALPEPLPFPGRSAAKLADSRWVRANGVVRSTTNQMMMVMERNGLVPVWVGGVSSPNALARYVDCLVSLRGAFSLQVAPEPVLFVPSSRFIEVNESAPDDPFIIPSFAINKVCSPNADAKLQHRRKVTGVVTYCDQQMLVVQDHTGGALVLGNVAGDLSVGDRAEIVGFANLDEEAVTLRESVARKIGDANPPEPIKMMMEGLLDGRLNCWLVRLEGIVLDQKSRQGRQLLELQNGQRVFEAVLAESSGHLKPLPIGSRVEVTGVTQLQIASRSPTAATGRDYPLVATMGVLMRTPADLVLLERPPWWTWRHTAIVGAGLVAILIAAVGWIRSLRRRVAQRTNELQAAMSRLQKETELSATLAERERLAAEIHDTLEQGLSGIMMQLDGADTRLTSDTSGARENLELARRMVRFSRAEVRHSLWNLESQLLKDGDLGAAIKEIARQASAGSSTTVAVDVSGARFALPPAIEHHLLRCTQEAISNALKHSGATNIRVKLGYSSDKVELEIADDGSGFDPGQVLTGPGSHLGLRNLRSRTRKMKGQLDITSEPHKGTTVHLTVSLTGQLAKATASAQ